MMRLLSAPLGASSASEWLSHAATRLSAAPATLADVLATVATLTAALERQEQLTAPSATAMATLHEPLSRLPRQLTHLSPGNPAFGWLQLSALAELHGEFVLARLVIDTLADRLGEHDGHRALTCGIAPDERDELLALCWTRRGRIARIGGHHDDAHASFDEAVELAGSSWRDARIAAELGLANLAIARGNYPQAETRCTALLSAPHAATALSDVHLVALYQMRAIAYRKRGQLLDALLDSWRAYDLLGHASAHRAELMVSMAETALEARDVSAALAAFARAQDEATISGAPLRVLVATATGYARASLALDRSRPAQSIRSMETVRTAAARLTQLLTKELAPREHVGALVALAECQLHTGEYDAAAGTLDKAGDVASRHAFHDLVFGIQALRSGMRANRESPANQPPVAPSSPSAVPAMHESWSSQHPARVRLTALARPS